MHGNPGGITRQMLQCLCVCADSGVGADARESRWNNAADAAVSTRLVCSAVYAGTHCSRSTAGCSTVPSTGNEDQSIFQSIIDRVL